MLGPYEIELLLGAGGMGEVYRARDTRLDRVVALKTLLPDLTLASDSRARFEREARAISALTHPHICALYDVGREGATEYLVMEYLEGETLADKISRGPLPLSQTVRIGGEIAQALGHAHRAGIIHRDLKPANIMITAGGAKLLDFGLAKLTPSQRVFSDASAPSTQLHSLTAEGTISGTVVYMSPEQLEARAVDARTDIFSLGVILYEATTGRRPFSGNSPLSVIAAILTSDPAPVRSLRPELPEALERIIATALEKNPDQRWQTAQDVARQLQWLTDTSSSASRPPVHRPLPFMRTIAIVSAVLLAAVAGALLAWLVLRHHVAGGTTPETRLDLVPPPGIAFAASSETPNMAISPDGQALCFSARDGGRPSLFVRPFNSFGVRKLDGSEGGSAPFWSSDGQWIGFSAQGKLWRLRASGGSVPELLCEVSDGGAIASWVGDTILFTDRAGGRREIYRVSSAGGPASPITRLGAADWRHTWPRLLHDGRHFLYVNAALHDVDRQLVLASLDSPASAVLLRNVSSVTLVADDQILYVRDGRLLAQRIDVDHATIVGAPTLLAGDVDYFYPSGCAAFDSANGVVVYRTDTSTGRLAVADRHGVTRTIDDRGPFASLGAAYSNDGSRVAVTVVNRATGLGDLWIYDLAHGTRDRFTNEPGLAITPVWAPDDRSIVYSAAGAGALPHLVRRTLATDHAEDLMPHGTFQFAGSFARDGSAVYFERTFPRTGADIFRLDLATRKVTTLLDSTFEESDPQISPNGAWLAYSSDVSGVEEVYLQSTLNRDVPRIRVSISGGRSPRWRRDGGELFYLSAQNSVMSTTPGAVDHWSDARTTELFRAPADLLQFTAAPDGQSFLLIEGSAGPNDRFLHVIRGWK
jgi:serine/threonine protein kinase